MARPTLGDSDTLRLQLKITADEVDAIDNWRFANRVPSRSEAVRRLCEIALSASQIASPAGETIRSAQDEAMEASPVTAQPAVGEVSPSIAERVRGVIGGMLVAPNVDDLKDGASLIDDLGADSLDLVEIVMAMESEFGIEVPDADAERLLTVRDAIRYVEKAKGGDHG